MIVGCPKEIKTDEYRVALVPSGVEDLKRAGHKVLVQIGAGEGSGIADAEYRRAGAAIAKTARQVFAESDMIIKVKEPLEPEWPMMRPGQIVFTYFHFAASRKLTRAVVQSGVTAIAYETVQVPDGTHPLLTPMSEVAGRMAIQQGAKYLERTQGGRGVLLSGVPGVKPADVVVFGGGVVGSSAAKIAAGSGARVTVLDINLERMRYLDDVMPANVRTLMSNSFNVRTCLQQADLLVGAVLIVGARAPVLVTREDLKIMKNGSVIVDVAIDQGGCFETSRPTTHSDPTYVVEGVIHYCVANMPGAVSRTSTFALTNATLPYTVQLADLGRENLRQAPPELLLGINCHDGKVTNRPVAEACGMKSFDFQAL